MDLMITITFILVVLNFLMLAAIGKRTDRMEKMIARGQAARQARFEDEFHHAMDLIRQGKTDEAKQAAERILDS